MSIITDLWASIQLGDAMEAMVTGIGGQITEILPYGVAIIGAMAIPSIIKRVFRIFV